jgi:hypothetical protein
MAHSLAELAKQMDKTYVVKQEVEDSAYPAFVQN